MFQGQGYPHQDLIGEITKENIVEGFKCMKTEKAPETDKLAVETWQALGSEGVDIL